MSNASINPAAHTPSSQDAQSLAGVSSASSTVSEARTQPAPPQPGVAREASGSAGGMQLGREASLKSSSLKVEGSHKEEKGDAKKVQAKHSPAITNSLQRLADAKQGKRDLKMLLLCDIKVTELDIAALAPSVKASTGLRSLSLYGSGLTAAAAKMLAAALASHESLTMLDLGNNALGSKGVEDVSNALIHNSSLLNLGMARTDMQDEGATAVSHVLRMNMSLTEVYLNNNGITQIGAQELAGALLFNDSSRLSKLFLFNNPLTEAGIMEFVKLIQDSPTVQERIALSEELALAFAMCTHKRLGENSKLGQWLHHSQEQLQNLQNIVAQNVTAQNTTAQKHKRRLLNLGQLTLKIIKLSHTFRRTERRIEGEGFPNMIKPPK